MGKITASNLAKAINNLPRNVDYTYINPKTSGKIFIEDVRSPEGPIHIRRWNPNKGETKKDAGVESISSEMLWRIANALSEGDPINVDRVFGGSYNTRSVLETLIAHTPEFYYCYPGRIKDVGGVTSIEKGHKHLLWLPNEPHENGRLCERNVEGMAVSEIPMQTITYDAITLPDSYVVDDIDIDVARRHIQMQIALYCIGFQLGYSTYIARNDSGVIYQDSPLIQHEGIIKNMNDETMLSGFPNAADSASLIDCIWFQNRHLMPAVMEVEHSTGVISGLDRMNRFRQYAGAIMTRYVIVAPDEDRDTVIEKINRPEFRDMDARYFPYSSVEELYSICKKRNLKGVTEQFLDCYMEKVVT
jgi:type II restriction enzyme